jgi:hypothetical protein
MDVTPCKLDLALCVVVHVAPILRTELLIRAFSTRLRCLMKISKESILMIDSEFFLPILMPDKVIDSKGAAIVALSAITRLDKRSP